MTSEVKMTDTVRKLQYEAIRHLLAPRARDAHKGDFGHVLVVGGNAGFGGAALMAAMSAARTGAGLVSVATHPDHSNTFIARCPELMVKAIADGDDLQAILESASVVVLGPGLGQDDWSRLCLHITLADLVKNPRPLVLDADALNLVSRGVDTSLLQQQENHILTPHPGEAARLLDCSTADVQQDRPAAATALQKKYGGAVILKGAGSLACFRQGERLILEQCIHGNPGMASGGMGDVLSGVLGGLLAQGLTLANSARLGICIHGLAADRQAESHGERGMLATDLLDDIRLLANP